MKKKVLKSKCKVEAVENVKNPRHLADKFEIMIKDLNQYLNKAENEIEKIIKNLEEKTGIIITSIELNEDDTLYDEAYEDSIHVTLTHNLFNKVK